MPDFIMNENPSNIWQRPWRKPMKLVAWIGVLAVALFVIIAAIGLFLKAPGRDLLDFALIGSALGTALMSVAVLFVRWLWDWRNFRRFLFAVACLITLIALAYAEENWRGQHAWVKYRRQWEARGEKFGIAALIPPPVPDEENFALIPLLRPCFDFTEGTAGIIWRDTNGLARLDGLSAELSPRRETNDHLTLGSLEKGTFAEVEACRLFYRGNTNYPQAATSITAAEEILIALGKFAPELDQLREAAHTRADSRFPIPYQIEPSWGILLPHLARVKALTLLAHVRAVAELEAGKAAEAQEDLKVGWRLSDSIHDEPFLIDHLVRVATLSIDLQTLREGLVRHAWSERQLADLQRQLASIDLLAEYRLAMAGERACSTDGLDYLRRQGFRTNPMDYLARNTGTSGNSCFPVLNFMPSGWYYQNMLTISRLHQDYFLPIADQRAHRVFPQISDSGERALKNLRAGPYTILAKFLAPALQNAVRRSARTQTYVDAARLACALERYRAANGQFPHQLEALVPRFSSNLPSDVIDGKPLRYRPTPEGGYLIYSVGWNETDDGGELAWTKQAKQTSVDINKGDWVWQMPHG